jgi:alpha-glucosidase
MQWDSSAQAGFTSGTPWLPLAESHEACNVETLSRDPHSILTLYRRLLQLRRTHKGLSIGRYRPVETPDDKDVIAYERYHGNDRFGIALNLGGNTERFAWPWPARVVLSSCRDRDDIQFTDEVELQPNEGLILTPVSS